MLLQSISGPGANRQGASSWFLMATPPFNNTRLRGHSEIFTPTNLHPEHWTINCTMFPISVTISEKSSGSHLRRTAAERSDEIKDKSRRILPSALILCSGPRTAPRACVRRLAGRERPSPAFTEKKKKERIAALLPLICRIKLPCPSPPLPFQLPSHIRSGDWPIKHRKYVSIDECSAQAEKAQFEAATSSSTSRTADISQPASTTRAYTCLDFRHILHEILGTDKTTAQPSPGGGDRRKRSAYTVSVGAPITSSARC